MSVLRRKKFSIALAFAAGAILLSSCGERAPQVDSAADEAMMTEYSENLTIIESQNGKRSYRFTTPLVEGYSQAREPYREFRKGIRMVTYQDDSLTSVDVVLTANYAIYYENRKLWEAKGNVVVEKHDGKKLYTQQLFWNATTKKVYSNVDTRIVQEGRSDAIGVGFERRRVPGLAVPLYERTRPTLTSQPSIRPIRPVRKGLLPVKVLQAFLLRRNGSRSGNPFPTSSVMLGPMPAMQPVPVMVRKLQIPHPPARSGPP